MKTRNERAAIALDGTTLSVAMRVNGAWRWESIACDATPDGIASAFTALGTRAPTDTPVSVTLLRPLANARTLPFPSMSRDALENVLARDWTRYVIGLRATPHTAAARQIGRSEWRAAFAPTDTLDAVARIAEELSWRDVVIQASDDALASNAADAKESVVIVCGDDGPTDAMQTRNGEPILGRRLPAHATIEDVRAFIKNAGTPSVLVIGARFSAAQLAQAIGRGARVVDTELSAGTPSDIIIATAGAATTPRLQLLSASARGGRTREMRRLTWWLWLAAAAALLAAFAIDRWGVNSALNDVQRHRADISAQVTNAMAARTNVETNAEAVATLSEREAAASRVSGVIASIANALPAGTSLATLNVTGDSVTIEGESKRSATVYDALRSIPTLEQVRLAGPIRQERQAGDVPVERFSFFARIKPAFVVKR